MSSEKINKKAILFRLVEIPAKDKRLFYAREMKFLNILCQRYSLEFMAVVDFKRKFDSLAYLVSPKLKKNLDQKFRAFNYKLDETAYPTYDIGEKVGEDTQTDKRKTIKDFLNE